jgi:leucyl/phenylalanyl-tRNA--protein transferase
MHPDLAPHILLHAYANGIFPMADDRTGELYWFNPDPRSVIFPDACRLSRVARRRQRQRLFETRIDTAFERVIRACSHRVEGTWINTDITQAYCGLRDLGFAHSVEAWRGGELVGGLYGVALGSAFFGESMFRTVSGASKHALLWLIQRCRIMRYTIIDVQWLTPHLQRFGAVEIPRRAYLRHLVEATAQPRCFLHRYEVPPDWVTWCRRPREALLERRLLAAPRH